ncbi:MAG: DUF29 family protein [Nostoc sp.]|uniref:DUF29 family protein n=1 Tax=Nostoc sp. TaxID=1180 RepID=UPI002FF4CE7D
MVLLQYWQVEYERNYRHWIGEVKTFRYDLNNHLTTNLMNKLQDDLENIYQSAIDLFNCVGELFVDIAFYENVAMAIALG